LCIFSAKTIHNSPFAKKIGNDDKNKLEMFTMDSIREAVAGTAAGAFSKTLLAPLDRLKLVVQLRGSIIDSDPQRQQQQTSSSSNIYRSGRLAFSKIIQEEGFWALWRGNVPTILIQGGTTGLNFLFLDLYKKAADQFLLSIRTRQEENHQLTQSQSNDRKDRLTKSFVSGALAGLTGITLMYPLGLMRTKLALDMGKES